MLRRVVERSGSATRRLLRERNGAVVGRRFQEPRRGFAVDAKVNWGCFGLWHRCGFLGFSRILGVVVLYMILSEDWKRDVRVCNLMNRAGWRAVLPTSGPHV